MSLDDYTGPNCQFANCSAPAEFKAEHKQYGTVQVCQNCISLWDEDEREPIE